MKRKPLEYYLKADYPFTVRPDNNDGGYIIGFPDLQYCVGTGDTINAAIADAMIVKEEWLKAAYEDGIAIPEPANAEEYSGRVSLRIPKSLHKSVAEVARKEGVSINQLISHLISLGIGGIKRRP